MLGTVKYLLGTAGTSGYGSKTTAEEVTEACPDLRSITGATSGIGAETARVLAMRGARLVLPARSLKAAEETRARILSFVARFESLQLPFHLLINNAGKFPHGHAISEDGIEMTLATNYLAMQQILQALHPDEAAAGEDDGDGEGDGHPGPHRQRLLQHPRLVLRRRPSLP